MIFGCKCKELQEYIGMIFKGKDEKVMQQLERVADCLVRLDDKIDALTIKKEKKVFTVQKPEYVSYPGGRRLLSPETRTAIKKDVEEGYRQTDIAKKYALNTGQAWYYAKLYKKQSANL